MAGTEKDTGPEDRDAARFAEQLRASAQQVWLAGVGAFARAQEEGGKLFDALVREGSALQGKQADAGDRIAQAASRMADMASEFSARAGDRIEGIFDQRVAKAVANLGMASAEDVERLAARVEELERTVARLGAKATAPRRRAARTEAKPSAPRARPRDGG
jgi:poly(hydroxyalkanoate) granule-associated protein